MGRIEPDALPDELASWPTYAPSAHVLGQVELALGSLHGPAPEATVDVPIAVGGAAAETGHLVLTDAEGTPLADVTVDAVSAGDAGASVRIAGRVRALRAFRAGPFRKLRRRPAEVRQDLAGATAIAVVLDRPLTADDERSLAAAATASDARLLVLPCVADAGPAGIPPEVLVRAVQASLSRLETPAGPVLLVPLPLVRGNDTPPEAIEFVRATGATLADPELMPDAAGGARIAAALDAEPGVLEDFVEADVAAILRSWRPRRPKRGLTVFFTGLSGSGKSTLARGVADAMLERGRSVTVIDGDIARRLLSSGLGFSAHDRDLNVRRIGWVASEVTRHGGVAVCAPIAPFATTRADVRRMVERNGGFVLVHVSTPLAVCEERDHKGLYAKARAGQIAEFTGVSSPYEMPEDADVRIDTSTLPVDDAVAAVVAHLEREGWLRPQETTQPAR
ncbi:MAG TPA: adenylyl-sulfate kinase [Jiangellaceae bacterium]